jgi:hypothetical protein
VPERVEGPVICKKYLSSESSEIYEPSTPEPDVEIEGTPGVIVLIAEEPPPERVSCREGLHPRV